MTGDAHLEGKTAKRLMRLLTEIRQKPSLFSHCTQLLQKHPNVLPDPCCIDIFLLWASETKAAVFVDDFKM